MRPPLLKILSTAKVYVKDIFNVVSSLVENDLGVLKNEHPNYQHALKVLSIFEVRISRISRGIFDLISSDNLYSCKILLRALIEYSFKIDFLVKKSISDQSEEIFNDYILFCDLAEELQFKRGIDYTSEKLTDSSISEEALNDLYIRKPEIKRFSKKEIFEKANQFSFRNIFEYINTINFSDLDEINEHYLKEIFKSFLNLGVIYSDLSSFVHGGPESERYELLSHLDKEFENDEFVEIIEYVMVMHFYSCLSYIYFCNHLDSKYFPKILLIFDKILSYYDEIKLPPTTQQPKPGGASDSKSAKRK